MQCDVCFSWLTPLPLLTPCRCVDATRAVGTVGEQATFPFLGKKDRWSWGAIVGSTVEVTVEVTMEVTVEDTVKAFAAALVVDAAVATTLTAAEGHGITKVHEDDGQGAPADVDHEET
ncbi:hypothetical protein MTO96_006774 [Rhipicephalus appendiculatus]